AAIKEAVETKALERGRQLVRLDTAVPVPLDWDGWHRRQWDAAKLLALFQDWGFRGLANRMRGELARADAPPTQGDLFAGIDGADAFPFGANAAAPEPAAEAWDAEYTLIATPAAFKAFLK